MLTSSKDGLRDYLVPLVETEDVPPPELLSKDKDVPTSPFSTLNRLTAADGLASGPTIVMDNGNNYISDPRLDLYVLIFTQILTRLGHVSPFKPYL